MREPLDVMQHDDDPLAVGQPAQRALEIDRGQRPRAAWRREILEQLRFDLTRATERYETLGGAVVLQGRKHDVGLGPSSVQTMVQVSQAWCRIAIEKPNNTAVLRNVTLADKSATKSTEIKANIAQLSLRMLGDVPSDADVNELYDDVYLPLEPASTKAAWTAVCAALVRNPKWLSY